jgi:general L-amino acid transport system permease protein
MMSAQGDTPARGGSAFWNDPKFRSIFFQVLVVAVVFGFGWFLFHNTTANLERQGIASGFEFWNSTAGFGIIDSWIPYSEESTYGTVFWVGLLNTLTVSILGIILATVLGFVIGIARLSSNWLISRMATVYIETLRNIPLLLQILFWYNIILNGFPNIRNSIAFWDTVFLNNRGLYTPKPVYEAGSWLVILGVITAISGIVVISTWSRRRQARTGEQFPVFLTSLGLFFGLPVLGLIVATMAYGGSPISFDYPALKGFNFKGGSELIPELVALLLALSVYTAAFIAEIVRAGILAVSHGQTEAAHSLGLRNGPTLRLVIIPQALRVIIPPLTSQYLNLTKNSSLAAAIAYPELVSVFAGTVLNQTGQAVEVIGVTMALYLSLSLLISLFMNWYNKKMALVER